MDVDITAGSCSFSRKGAEYIPDSEWAMITYRIAKLKLDFAALEVRTSRRNEWIKPSS
jgi:hypothetical protein